MLTTLWSPLQTQSELPQSEMAQALDAEIPEGQVERLRTWRVGGIEAKRDGESAGRLTPDDVHIP